MVRTATIASIGYSPEEPPSNNEELRRYLYKELSNIAAEISKLAEGHLEKTYAPPAKPRDGDFRYADGTTWNPGSGIGFYRYNGSAWVFLG